MAAALPVRADDEIPPLPIGKPAPNFVTRTLDGKPLSLKSLRGHVVLVDFWATWCGPCRMATPALVDLYKEYHRRGLEIVALSLDDVDTRDQIPEYKKVNHVKYTLAYAPEANVKTALAYHTNYDPNSGMPADSPVPPSVFVIDKKGRVQYGQIGYSLDEEAELKKLIGKLVREKG